MYIHIGLDTPFKKSAVFTLSERTTFSLLLAIVENFDKVYNVIFFFFQLFLCFGFWPRSHWLGVTLCGPRREKTCLRGFANSTGADQPAHPRRLISAFSIRSLESIISKLATLYKRYFIFLAQSL